MMTVGATRHTGSRRLDAWVGLSVAVLLITAAMIVPAVTGLNVHQSTFPPLHASWRVRVGPGTVPAIALATVDGWRGIGHIPLHSQGNWQIQIAGHPPGALLFFVLLVRVGLGSGLAAGMVVVVIAASVPVAVHAHLATRLY